MTILVEFGEFQGYEFCWIVAGVGEGVREAAGCPSHLAGLEAHRPGRLAFDRAVQGEVADGDEEVRAGVVHGSRASGLEFDFGDADAVFDEEDLFGAVGEDVEAAVFVPFCGGVAKGFVLEDFDGYVAEGCSAGGAHDVGEGGAGEADVAVGEFEGDGGLVLDGVEDFGAAQGDGEVVVAVPVHQGFVVGRDFDVEDAHGFVFEGEVVVRLVGNFDFRGDGLSGQQDQAEESGFHAGIVALGEKPGISGKIDRSAESTKATVKG
jgi:hypothetical protein